ncbi:MAG TPA: retroviral-like aspartic protease family protein [Sphingomicrobium sp.]|jgi:predicted aspartyl protease|nr:retroviral-like aspartic protease family protein [Sphingomicrobium sp.]
MARTLLAIGMLATVAAPPLVAQTRATEIEAVSAQHPPDKTTQTEDVRFRNDGNERMTVPVRLSGTGPYRFLVDTGSERTAISRDLAERLNLPSGNAAALHSIAGVTRVATATVPSLQLTRRNVKVVDAPLLDRANMGADGILGVDSLKSQRVQFDFESKTMSIVPSAAPSREVGPDAIVVTANRLNGRLVVTKAAADGHALTVVLDTGSEVTIANSALRRRLLGKHPKPMEKVALISVTGEQIMGDYMFIRELDIGGVQLKHLAVVFADAHAFDKLGLGDRPAMLLGMNAMRAFKRVSIDFGTRKLRVLLPEESHLDVRLASAAPWRR